LEENRALAARGLRVIAIAEKAAAGEPTEPYADLSLIGLVGLSDPPRKEVSAALAGLDAAGIRVVMATGDQAVTARRVAEQVGLTVTGEVLDGLAVARLLAAGAAGSAELLNASVLARVAPEQKLQLIALHQGAGHVVAMTGDGVNDAPALRRADIGVAMGLRGTEVAREAADMVLLDDAFGTILAAVKEGRVIFDNIRAFVLYLLSCNLSEVMTIGLAGLLGYPLPLLPLQILFLNLVTDVLPALALGAGRGDARILARPPRPASEPLLAPRHWRSVIGYGALLTLSTLGAFELAFRLPGATSGTAITVAFLTLALGQVWHVFNMRDPGSSLVNNQVTRNRLVWAAVLTCSLIVALAVALPGLRQVLAIELLGARGWTLVAVAGLLPMLLGQVGKALGLGRVS
ncbi:MAG TPA: HAD-IC family P-type ATPase, partial [Trueperaceae bacterium]|nr:HAD-IC family P-type ATPase [Trueperaceae bacterium]